jgi:hypothetical protein
MAALKELVVVEGVGAEQLWLAEVGVEQLWL